MLTWQITGEWRYDDDLDRASEIEVRLSADGPDRTLVELEHRHVGRLVAGQALRDGIERGGGGWSSVLDAYVDAASAGVSVRGAAPSRRCTPRTPRRAR